MTRCRSVGQRIRSDAGRGPEQAPVCRREAKHEARSDLGVAGLHRRSRGSDPCRGVRLGQDAAGGRPFQGRRCAVPPQGSQEPRRQRRRPHGAPCRRRRRPPHLDVPPPRGPARPVCALGSARPRFCGPARAAGVRDPRKQGSREQPRRRGLHPCRGGCPCSPWRNHRRRQEGSGGRCPAGRGGLGGRLRPGARLRTARGCLRSPGGLRPAGRLRSGAVRAARPPGGL